VVDGQCGSMLPAELASYVTFPVHEGRILDRLPAIGITAPSIEIIQVNSVTGSASTVAEGGSRVRSCRSPRR
jgi:hypothetical protein